MAIEEVEMRFLAKRLRWVLVGAGAAWLLDPEHAERREMAAKRARALLARVGFVGSPSETATVDDVVTDAEWAWAQDAHRHVDERRLAASGVR
jgi:hypothetical protein